MQPGRKLNLARRTSSRRNGPTGLAWQMPMAFGDGRVSGCALGTVAQHAVEVTDVEQSDPRTEDS